MKGLPLPSRQTVAEFLQRWLDTLPHTGVRETTQARYRMDVRRHILPALGKRKLSELRPGELQSFFNGLASGGLSPASVRHCRAVLRAALGQAVAWGELAANPAKPLKMPALKRDEAPAIGPDDARAIIGAFSDHELGALVLFSIATGARQGEALGLRWPDCDLDAGSVTIRYQLQRIDGENRLTEPKTAKSRRTLPISPTVVETLRRQQRWQTEQRLRAGAGWQDSGHVFTTPNGAPLNGASVTHRFQKRLAQAELPRLRWHDLRHGCASLLLAQGADLRTIMELLGHSQISLTANLYTHLIPALKRDASDRMERVLTGSQASLPLSFYQ